jgi:Ca2+-transporting ATPase
MLVFILSFLQHKSAFDSFLFAVSLAVAAVPEGLPAVMTITLAIGVERMSREKAVVRKLNAIETLGSITLVATDKTGTLTTNEMKVKKIWVEGKTYEIKHAPSITANKTFHNLVLNGVLCSTASLVLKTETGRYDVIGDTTEGALLLMATELGQDTRAIKADWEIIEEQPFDPSIKRMTVVVKKGSEKRTFTKGSPEAILSYCELFLKDNHAQKLDKALREKIESEFESYARKGLRMLAFAEDRTFIGFVGIADPVRAEAAEAVKSAHRAGIKVVMLTGDSPLTAEAIGLETGII